MVALVIGLAASGVAVGICSGLLGIGGGVLMVPILRVAFGLTAYAATATSLFAIVPTSVSGMVSHLRQGTCMPRLGLAMGLGGAATSTLGVWLGSRSPEWAIMGVTAAIIAYSAVTMLQKALRLPREKGSSRPQKTSAAAGHKASQGAADQAGLASQPPASAVSASSSERQPSLLGGVGIGLLAGLASGYCGVGGGFVMVPLMTQLLGVSMRKASGTSLVAIMVLAIPGVIEQALLGNVDFLAGILLSAGAIPGAVVGARLNAVMPERQLRLAFSALLAVAAASLVLRELGVL